MWVYAVGVLSKFVRVRSIVVQDLLLLACTVFPHRNLVMEVASENL